MITIERKLEELIYLFLSFRLAMPVSIHQMANEAKNAGRAASASIRAPQARIFFKDSSCLVSKGAFSRLQVRILN